MQHTIKIYRNIAGLACLAVTLAFAGCNAKSNKSTTDTTIKKDSGIAVKDSTGVMKTDSDSTSMKMAPIDSLATPARKVHKIDTNVKPRPLDRKTRG